MDCSSHVRDRDKLVFDKILLAVEDGQTQLGVKGQGPKYGYIQAG